MEITVDGTPQDTPISAVVVSPRVEGLLKVTKLPFKAPATVPEDFVGSFEIQGSMSSKPGEPWPGDGLVGALKALLVKVPAALQRIEVYPSDVTFEQLGESQVLAVYGTYADNVQRSIGSSFARSATGTSYTSSDPKIASVSPVNGTVRAEGYGKAIVTVENSGIAVHVPVNVRPETP